MAQTNQRRSFPGVGGPLLSLLILPTLLLPAARGAGTLPASPPQAYPEAVPPSKGVFLVASPDMEDPRFQRTVILLVDHGEKGTLGFIVNRITDMPLSKLLPGLEPGAPETYRLCLGGPVGLNSVSFLVRSREPVPEMEPVLEEVYFSGESEILERLLAEKKDPEELRLFLGYSGWRPGQLEAELAAGAWNTLQANAETLFNHNPQTLWRDLSRPARRPSRWIVSRPRDPGLPNPSAGRAPGLRGSLRRENSSGQEAGTGSGPTALKPSRDRRSPASWPLRSVQAGLTAT